MKFFDSSVKAFLVLILFVSALKTSAQELTKEFKTNTVNKISTLLEDKYVFPDVAEKCGEHIRKKLNEGAFDTITLKEEFAAALTKELQSVSRDKHMRVRVDQRPVAVDNNTFYQEFLMRQQSKEENLGFAKVEYLEGGIGYLDLRFFAPLMLTQKLAESAMNLLSNSDAVIIDLRKNRGGNPDLIRFISSYFFSEPTHLNSLYFREGNKTEEFWTSKVKSSTLTDVPIFVLTSNFTFSGGEEFTYNLKTRKRATIIGETTGGGANPGGVFSIEDSGLGIFIPTGRAINPITNTNWEGTGVEPDIKTSSDQAYDVALDKAKTAAEEHRNRKNEKAMILSKNISGKLNEAEKILSAEKNKAENLIKDALEEGLSSGMIDENSINMAGYDYLAVNKVDMAITIFRYNVYKFPGSANTYDSLGEAYLKNNQNDLAITNYKKSLELNPENKNAEEIIKKISN